MENFNKSENVSLYDLNQAEVIKHLPLLICYVLILITGIVGNILVIIIYKWRFDHSRARVYILSLAATDLSVCVIGIPYHVLDLTWVVIYTNGYLCKVLTFLMGSAMLSSTFVLLVVGLDRYLKVCRPLKRQIIDFGDKRTCFIVICVAVVFNIPYGFIYGNSSVTTAVVGINGTDCFVSDGNQGTKFTFLFLGLNLLICIVAVAYLTVIYGLIGKKIYDNDKSMDLHKKRRRCNCVSTETESISSEKLDEECNEDIEICVKTNTNTNNSLPDLNKADDTNADIKANEDIYLTLDDKQSIIFNDTNKKDVPSKSTKKETNKDIQRSTTTITKHNQSVTLVRHVSRGQQNKNNRTGKITIMMLTITIVFVVTNIPVIVISIFDSVFEDYWSEMSYVETLVHSFMLRLYLVNNMANPFIYGFWDKKFRTECVKLIRSLCWFKQ